MVCTHLKETQLGPLPRKYRSFITLGARPRGTVDGTDVKRGVRWTPEESR